MAPIGSVTPRVADLKTPATTAANTVAAPVAAKALVGTSNVSAFEAPTSGAPQKAWPFSFRGTPDSEVGKAITAMLDRMKASGVTMNGDSVDQFFTRNILENKKVTNEQLLAMTKIPLSKLETDAETKAKVLKKIPNARELPSHKFTVALMAGATGIDPAKLSEACPDLGMTGAPGTPLFYAPTSKHMQASTALHDFTDYLRGAGLAGMNKAVWGSENRVISALISVFKGAK